MPRGNPNYERDPIPEGDEREMRQPSRLRRSIPVHQWRIEFSGEGRGPHLYDFLFQLCLHHRSEHVSDREMLVSVAHLLSGFSPTATNLKT